MAERPDHREPCGNARHALCSGSLWSVSEICPDFSTDTTLAPGGRYTWIASGMSGRFDVDVWDRRRDQ